MNLDTDRINQRIEELQEKLNTLPKGYISHKMINGSDSYYLQWREGSKVKSKHISKDQLEETSIQVALRKQIMQELRELNQLKRIAKYKNLEQYLK